MLPSERTHPSSDTGFVIHIYSLLSIDFRDGSCQDQSIGSCNRNRGSEMEQAAAEIKDRDQQEADRDCRTQ